MKSWRILVIDGQGGGIGKQLTQIIKESIPSLQNHIKIFRCSGNAESRGGDDSAAENAVIVRLIFSHFLCYELYRI